MTAVQPGLAERGLRAAPPASRRRLAYVCLQQTVEGQASYAHVHEIVRGLERRGWEVELREIRADRSRKHGRLYYLWHYLKPQLRLWTRGGDYHAMYIRSDALALPAFLWATRQGIPVIQEVNGPSSDRVVAKPWLRPFAGLLARLQRYQLRRSAALTAVTPRLSEWLKGEAPGRSVTLIPNGANTELFHPGATTTIPTPPRYVILVGLLARWQGISLLLSALECPEWPHDVSLVIAGDGDEREKIARAARTNPLIHHLGVVPYREVPGLIAGSLAGLSLKTSVPGRVETGMSPLKLYETLACGVPAIVTNYHGQAEVVREHDCGIVVSQNNPADLARAVGFLAQNPAAARQLGDRGLAAVRAHHSWDNRAALTDRLLRSVLP